jgi:hypothetical protein
MAAVLEAVASESSDDTQSSAFVAAARASEANCLA